VDGRDAGDTGAVGPAVAGRGALRTVPAWTSDPVVEGEDDLDAFPLPPEARSAELEAVVAASGMTESPDVAAVLPVAADATEGDGVEFLSDDPEESIRRFHQKLGLVPAEPAAVVPVTAEVVAEGGGGEGDGGGPASGAAGGGGGKGRRRPFQIIDKPMTIFEHLDELRRRIMWAGLAFVAAMAVVLPFYNPIIDFLQRGYQAQSLAPMAAIYAVMRVTVMGGLVLASPVILYQAIAYIQPALTLKERRLLYSYLPASIGLLVAGVCFSLFVFEPILLRMGAHLIKNVPYDPSISEVINFGIGYSLPFGLLFELPIVITVLVALGVVTPELLIKNRRWAVLAIVVVAEMFTPPMDLFVTPSIIFVPLYGLYELSILLAKRAYRRRLREESAGFGDVA